MFFSHLNKHYKLLDIIITVILHEMRSNICHLATVIAQENGEEYTKIGSNSSYV